MALAEAVIHNEVAQEETEEWVEFEPIEKLETLGINKGDIKKAKDAGFHTCDSLLMNTKKTLSEIKGLSEAKIEKMVEAAKKMSDRGTLMTARELEVRREKEIVNISTGSTAVDELLQGGIETKSLTEIYGEYRCGKTQLCHMLCVTSQIAPKRPGRCCYIDTEGGFRPSRVRSIAARLSLPEEEVLNNIIYARAHTYEHQTTLLEQVTALMADEQFKLIVMDSITSCFRTDFTGRGELAERQQRLNILLAKLKKIAEEFNVAVVITNQIQSDPSGGAVFVSDPKKPVGGHVIAHASTIRLSLRKGKGEQRLLKVVQAPHLAEGEASFAITADGISDYKD